jgi:hypothetical protein
MIQSTNCCYPGEVIITPHGLHGLLVQIANAGTKFSIDVLCNITTIFVQTSD